jgi:hypothetical protein
LKDLNGDYCLHYLADLGAPLEVRYSICNV